MTAATGQRWLVVGAAGLALAALALHSSRLQPWTVDDAYITFRYAEHFAAGNGPVYNVGERVEGYTTPLWMGLLALGGALGASVPVLSKVLGIGCALAALTALGTSHRTIAIPVPAAAASTALFGTCGVVTAWVMSGMEVALVCLLVLATVLARQAGRPAQAGVWGALATMARPDALLVVAAAALPRGRLRLVAAFVALYGPFFAARWAYYGWLLPNTFYAKVGATSAQVWRGVAYTGEFAWVAVGVLVPLLAWVWVLRRDDGRAPLLARWGWVAGYVGLHAVYVTAVGGDGMPAFRFFAPVIAPLALLAGVGLAQVAQTRVIVWVVAAGAMSNVAFAVFHAQLHQRIVNGNVGRNGVEVGRFLAEQLPAGTWIATNTAGSVAYASGLPTLDMLGLNDAHIAHRDISDMGTRKAGHEKADGAYVLKRRPAVIMLGAARGRRTPVFRSGHELTRLPRFRRDYRFERYRLPSGAILAVYRRTDAPVFATAQPLPARRAPRR